MNFDFYLKEQLKLHPSMQMQDIIKMCYQATFGVEHLLSDIERAKQYFYQEYAATPADTSLSLYEAVSDEFCRVNLGAWKAADFASEELFELFVSSVQSNSSGSSDKFNAFINSAETLIASGIFSFSLEEWNDYYTAYKTDGIHAVHHSDAYRQSERPAYRLVQTRLLHTTISPIHISNKD